MLFRGHVETYIQERRYPALFLFSGAPVRKKSQLLMIGRTAAWLNEVALIVRMDVQVR